jgi:hypothetical protein
MKPRPQPKQEPKAAKRKLQIVKLEERIAPKIATNNNETLVRDSAKAPKVKPEQKRKLKVVKLEGRITPGAFLNHNETLVTDR